MRSVVDYRGQAVSALNRLNVRADMPIMAIWGEQDAIIPVQHRLRRAGSAPDARVEVMPASGTSQVERPTEVVDLIDDFIASQRAAEIEQPATPV